MSSMYVIVVCLLYAVLNVSGAALIKSEITLHNLNSVYAYYKFICTWRFIIGFFIVVISALVMFKALSMHRFSYVIPVATGMNFCLTVLIGVFLFGDRITFISMAGLLFILGGIVLMSLK